MAKKDIQERTLNFSIRIVNLCKFLRENGGTGSDLSKQLIPSGTSSYKLRIKNQELRNSSILHFKF
jgi:hypothetical protein